jgi:tetratricopeptide (TPR) repeat protein
MQQARARDLLLAPIAFVETLVRLLRREYELAVEHGREALELHPSSPFSRLFYAETLEHAGRPEEALVQYRSASAMAPEVPWIRGEEGRLLAKTGRREEASGILSELSLARRIQHVEPYHFALLLDALGYRDEAFQELERARLERSYVLFLMDLDPKADSLREDPRFVSLREQVFRPNEAVPATAG